MTLFALAHACWLYARLTDDAIDVLRGKVGGDIPDIGRADQRRAVIEFLNAWGCRQFATDYHALASQEMLDWGRKFLKDLPPPDKSLLTLTSTAMDAFVPVFDDLKDRTASYKGSGSTKHVVTFGATGAAKILFVLRMNVFLPWDMKIRDTLDFGDSGAEYVRFLKHAQERLAEVLEDARRFDITPEGIPEAVDRRGVPLTKLLDEFHWVTITRGCEAPDQEELAKWVRWARSG